MSNLTLILDRKELMARMDARTIRIDRPNAPVERIPLNMLDRVIVMGSPMVSCDVWRALASANIPAVLLPLRGNGAPAFMGAGLSSAVDIRVKQHLARYDDECAAKISRWLIDEKIAGQTAVASELSKGDAALNDFSRKMGEYRAGLHRVSDRNSLMGYEGTAANLYFKTLANLLPKKWRFSGRNKRPPKDPVNALLSLSYTLAGSEVRNAIIEKGLDPGIAFVHAVQCGRESLVFDILEPIRPEADRFSFQLLKRKLNLKCFTTNTQEGCLLNKEGRKHFYTAWATWQGETSKERSIKVLAGELIEKMVDFFPLAHQAGNV